MVSPKKISICGVDEAGKGSVIGPMIIAAVGCEDQDDLKEIGVADSKELTPRERDALNEKIQDLFPYAIVTRTAGEIDAMRKEMSMNLIVAKAHAEAIRALNPIHAYVDACDVNEKRYAVTVGDLVECHITARHKADSLFQVVSAASIVAKVHRDKEILKLHETYGDFGSGYPSDPSTIEFLKAYIREKRIPPPIARASWETIRKLSAHNAQRSMDDFA